MTAGAGRSWLALRSLAWTLLLPGVVAGYIPWRFFGLSRVRLDWSDPLYLVGLLLIVLGAALLLACILEFAHSGRGTLSPMDPPQQLVVRGLYRWVRNPMYLSVFTIVLGEWLLTRSRGMLTWWAAFFVAANLFVLGYEEPVLRRKFGQEYVAYTRRVGRWLPRSRRG
jgi:protein-S-isoprenylcysteine O-methyltransferase Ste14